MDKDDRELLKAMITNQEKHLAMMNSILMWFVIAMVFVTISVSSVSIVASVQHTREITEISDDYFNSDYDYGNIEQSVDIRNGVE